MSRNVFPTLAAAALAMAGGVGTATTADAAPTVIVSGNVVTGVDGILYDGVLYDALFEKGSCAAVFGSCNVASFAFSSAAAAGGVSNALISQVDLIPYVSANDGFGGPYNSLSSVYVLDLDTPFAAPNPNEVAVAQLQFVSINGRSPSIGFVDTVLEPPTATGNAAFIVYSIESTAPVTQDVPEPASAGLLAAGVAAVAAVQRRRKRK